MKSQIKIDILSDVVCPWCVIGYKRLMAAAQELGVSEQLNIEWHPFELNPQMPPEGENLRSHLANKYGTTLEGSINARQQLTELGQQVGFSFQYFDEMQMFNTRLAQIFMAYAKVTGKQTAAAEQLFSAYFSQGKNISDTQVIIDIASSLGIPESKVVEVLASKSLEQAVIEDEQYWANRGFLAVPVIMIDEHTKHQGAQDISTYKQALEKALYQIG